MKINKKQGIVAALIIVIIIFLITAIYYSSNYKRYVKYCEGTCDSKIVSNQLLSEVIATRTEKETNQIQQNAQAINRDVIKLDNAELNKEEQETYDNNQIQQVFDATAVYDIDELISLGDEYEQTLTKYDQLIEDNQIRIIKNNIEKKDEHISSLRDQITAYDLSGEEQADFENSLDYYNQIDYNPNQDYTISELSLYVSQYGLSEVNFENDLETIEYAR